MSDVNMDLAARIAHQCWCSYQMGVCQPYNLEPLAEQLESLKDGIRQMIENPNTTAEESHANWVRCKVEAGWKWGAKKNMDKKEHPNLVPYDMLVAVERAKDDVFREAAKFAIKVATV